MATAEVDAARDRRVDLYEVLQVSSRASPEVIQAAYRALARTYHPDVNPSPEAARQMRQLNAAYGVLSDPGKRAHYDALRIRPMRARRHAVGSDHSGTGSAGRPTPRPSYIRPVPTGVVSTLPRTGSLHVGRLLAVLGLLLFIMVLAVYGLYQLAGALDDEPMQAMVVPNQPPVVVDDGARPLSRFGVPSDIASSAVSHSDGLVPSQDGR